MFVAFYFIVRNVMKNTLNTDNAGVQIGLGFRRSFAPAYLKGEWLTPDFVEIAPENWAGIGGHWQDVMDRLAADFTIRTHGLSLSIGSPDPLDFNWLSKLKTFLDRYEIDYFSEHLSFSHVDNAHLYELLPLPFRADMVDHLAERIRIVQDYLERPLALENISYYMTPAAQLTELEFLQRLLEASDCNLLLDVNNVYVNASNHDYDPHAFIDALPLERVTHIHMAGHQQLDDGFIIDTHGEDMIEPVYALFEYVTQRLSAVPVLLERDNNFPDDSVLQHEMNRLRAIAEPRWQAQPQLTSNVSV